MKASAAKLGRLLEYYAGLAEDRARPGQPQRGPVDYYLDPDEPPGRWWGSGRGALGLDGEVVGDELRELLRGCDPASSESLGRGFGDSSARAFDCTFSAAKSVSLLWALTPDAWVRAEVLAAHEAAVDAALGWFEAHGAVTRLGTNGTVQVDTGGVTAALFRQHTSRTTDPQLHTHAIVASKVQDATGRWLSLDARFLKRQQTTIGWIYDAALRTELTDRLGVDWRLTDKGVLDLAVVPDDLIDEFSERSEQVAALHTELIQQWSDDHDGAEPDARTMARLQRLAVLDSRPDKGSQKHAADLHDQWAEIAHMCRFNPARLAGDRIIGHGRAGVFDEDAVLREAVRRAQDQSAAWLRADVARHIATLIPPGAASSAGELVELIDDLAARAEEFGVALGPELSGPTRRDGRPVTEAVTDRLFVTKDALAEEVDLQDWAQTNTTAPPVGVEPQRAAHAAITGHDRLVVVVGPAGTGKTTTTAHAVQTLQAAARPVVGLAPSGKAADVLAVEAGCRTDTLAGFLTRHQHHRSAWPEGTSVLLDEAGMARTDDLARLVELVRTNGWRLVAIGDPAQLPAVGRGGVFAHWCDTVAHVELETPKRFRQPWEANASLLLRAGDPEAPRLYAQHSRLRSTHPTLLPLDVARTYRQHNTAGQTVAITTNTAETARAINLAIQRPSRNKPAVRLADGTTAQVGDQIATRRNDPRLRTEHGERVRNRHVWAVAAIGDDGSMTVTHPERGAAVLPARYVQRHVELGWAVTGYGNQGDTVDVGIAVLEPGTNRSHAYVAMTRGRNTNVAVIADVTGEADPAETLAEMITRIPQHDSALALRAHLYEQAGIPEPPLPTPSTPAVDPDLAEKVRLTMQRLDALQARTPERGLGRSLGL